LGGIGFFRGRIGSGFDVGAGGDKGKKGEYGEKATSAHAATLPIGPDLRNGR
jgi:hypothetical protein